MTNLPHPAAGAADLGFQLPARHQDWLGMARAALNIKGTDFRSRHKPATKAYDFIAPGIP